MSNHMGGGGGHHHQGGGHMGGGGGHHHQGGGHMGGGHQGGGHMSQGHSVSGHMGNHSANHSMSRHSVTSRMTQGEYEAQNRQRYIARRTMARRPSRVQPLVIILLVMSIGIFLIGLVLTIIANWPGYSGIGGNPLEIVGPILIAVGGIVFIVGMVAICYRNHASKEQWEKAISERTMSRSRSALYVPGSYKEFRYNPRSTLGNISTLSTAHNSISMQPQGHPVSTDPAGRSSRTPSLNAIPGKGILKKSSSASSTGFDQDSGLAHTTANQSRDSDSSLGSAAHHYSGAGYRIEQLPDPLASRGAGARVPHGPIEHSSDNEGGLIPEPVRASRRNRGRAVQDNAAFTSGDESIAPPPRVQPIQSDTSGYDQDRPLGGIGNTAYLSDEPSYNPHPIRPQAPVQPFTQRPIRPQIRGAMPVRPAMPGQPIIRAPRPIRPGMPGQPGQMMRAPLGPGARPPFRPIGGPMIRGPRPMGAGPPLDGLHINIKAQPGTSVHITPDRNLSQDSIETPI